MQGFNDSFNSVLGVINGVLWHDLVLYVILCVGILFMIWSKFSPWIAITHGVRVIRGDYDDQDDPGAITHFQALSAALSATVGLGNIGGVALAVSLGGPGAVFWMWVVGFIGMAIKTVEVTQSMLYRNTSDSSNPHGGPMFVVSRGLARMNPAWAGVGRFIGYIFCVTLLVSTVTGGNMFQAWNVSRVTALNFGVPEIVSGFILAILSALVIIGGIKRIGAVAGKLVPFMCVAYLAGAIYVLILNFNLVPDMFRLIFYSAFNAHEAQGAFLGGTAGYAFLWGMKRALFSNEAGQGSAPIAHSAARTNEPVREGVVAGLEPLVDTIVVCTITALVILSSGAWNRGPEAVFPSPPTVVQSGEDLWTIQSGPLPDGPAPWPPAGQVVFAIVEISGPDQPPVVERIYGTVVASGDQSVVDWTPLQSVQRPVLRDSGVYVEYAGASLTSYAFDRLQPGLGRWLVPLASWLFALSTVISWSYYGEQAIVFMFGIKWVTWYKIIYSILIVVATSGLVTTDRELDNLAGLGTGVMLFANIPIMLVFSMQALNAYHDYVRRLRSGRM